MRVGWGGWGMINDARGDRTWEDPWSPAGLSQYGGEKWKRGRAPTCIAAISMAGTSMAPTSSVPSMAPTSMASTSMAAIPCMVWQRTITLYRSGQPESKWSNSPAAEMPRGVTMLQTPPRYLLTYLVTAHKTPCRLGERCQQRAKGWQRSLLHQ